MTPQTNSIQPNSHSCTDFWGLFCLLQAFPAFAQVSREWDLAVQQDETSHGTAMVENPGMQSWVQLSGEDKKVSVTLWLPCLHGLAELSAPYAKSCQENRNTQEVIQRNRFIFAMGAPGVAHATDGPKLSAHTATGWRWASLWSGEKQERAWGEKGRGRHTQGGPSLMANASRVMLSSPSFQRGYISLAHQRFSKWNTRKTHSYTHFLWGNLG